MASFASTIDLHRKFPSSRGWLIHTLDREIWLASFLKENGASNDSTPIRNLGKYRALWDKGAPRAIPMTCVLTVKKDKQLRPLCTKSCIVILGNHKDHVWAKSDKFPQSSARTVFASLLA